MTGFLPARGSLMLDAVTVAMFVLSLTLVCSVIFVKRGKYVIHRRLQIWMSLVLLLAIAAFEFDMRFMTNWRELAEPSRFYASGAVDLALRIHLLFAIPTPFIWGFVVVRALRRFPNPPTPSEHSKAHGRIAWFAVAMMFLTALTGWVFYVLAFLC